MDHIEAKKLERLYDIERSIASIYQSLIKETHLSRQELEEKVSYLKVAKQAETTLIKQIDLETYFYDAIHYFNVEADNLYFKNLVSYDNSASGNQKFIDNLYTDLKKIIENQFFPLSEKSLDPLSNTLVKDNFMEYEYEDKDEANLEEYWDLYPYITSIFPIDNIQFLLKHFHEKNVLKNSKNIHQNVLAPSFIERRCTRLLCDAYYNINDSEILHDYFSFDYAFQLKPYMTVKEEFISQTLVNQHMLYQNQKAEQRFLIYIKKREMQTHSAILKTVLSDLKYAIPFLNPELEENAFKNLFISNEKDGIESQVHLNEENKRFKAQIRQIYHFEVLKDDLSYISSLKDSFLNKDSGESLLNIMLLKIAATWPFLSESFKNLVNLDVYQKKSNEKIFSYVKKQLEPKQH